MTRDDHSPDPHPADAGSSHVPRPPSFDADDVGAHIDDVDGRDHDIIEIGIGIDSAVAAPGKRVATGRRQMDSAGRPPWKVIGAIVAAVIGLAVVFGLAAGNDRSADQALPTPSPDGPAEATPEADESGTRRADPSRPAPTAVVIPVVRGDIVRAGERCRVPVPAADRPESFVTFTIPDGVSARCDDDTRFWTDPVSARTDRPSLPLSVRVWPDTDLNTHFVRLSARVPDELVWHPVDGRRGWRYGHAPIPNTTHTDEDVWAGFRSVVVEVPGGSVDVSWISDESPLEPRNAERAFEQIVESIRIEPVEPDPFHELTTPWGWCSDDHWVATIPAGWFSGEACRWLNTSSESPVVLQCECLPPLWIEHGSIPLDGDFGFSRIDADETTTRADGRAVRIIEGLRRDSNNFDRELRAVIIEGDVERVMVIAAVAPEHALPGHTWQDTLDAQADLVESVRFHSSPDCGQGQRWIAQAPVVDPSSAPVFIDVGDRGPWPVPSGTALIGTGCTRRDTGHLEVRVEADPDLIGWVGAEQVRSAVPPRCPTAEGVFSPSDWVGVTEGDFDGDGRVDIVFARRPFDGTLTFTDVPTLAVLFADGGLAEGTIGQQASTGEPLFTADMSPRRIVGMGRDLLEISFEAPPRATEVQLRDATDCRLSTVHSSRIDRGPTPLSGRCVATVPGHGDLVRSWSLSPRSGQVDRPGGWTVETDVQLAASDGRLIVVNQVDANGPCGPDLGRGIVTAQPPSEDGPLHGTQSLTLQWLTAREIGPGAITFRVTPDGRYLVEGSQRSGDGEFVEIDGVVTVIDTDELRFDGTITTFVARLNGGEPCVRNAGQRFIRRPGSTTFRLQDRINCDGARTDWIDITLMPT